MVMQRARGLFVPVGSGHRHDGDTRPRAIRFSCRWLVSPPATWYRGVVCPARDRRVPGAEQPHPTEDQP